jgi:hypothetical protein
MSASTLYIRNPGAKGAREFEDSFCQRTEDGRIRMLWGGTANLAVVGGNLPPTSAFRRNRTKWFELGSARAVDW